MLMETGLQALVRVWSSLQTAFTWLMAAACLQTSSNCLQLTEISDAREPPPHAQDLSPEAAAKPRTKPIAPITKSDQVPITARALDFACSIVPLLEQ